MNPALLRHSMHVNVFRRVRVCAPPAETECAQQFSRNREIFELHANDRRIVRHSGRGIGVCQCVRRPLSPSVYRSPLYRTTVDRTQQHSCSCHTHSHHEPTNEMKRNNNKSNEKREKKTLQSSNGMIFSWLKAFNECTSAQSWCVEWIRFFSFSIEFRFCSLRSLATKCSGSVLILRPHDDDLWSDFGIKRNICRDDFIEIWTFSRRSYRLDFTFNCQRARFFPTAHAKNTNVHWIYWIEIPRRRGGSRDTSVSIYMQIEPFIDFLRFLRMNVKVSK